MEQKKTFKDFLQTGAGRACVIVVLYIVILSIFGILVSVLENATVGIIIALAFAIFGWKSLNKIQPDMFLFLPLAGWLIYFFLKLFVSILIGWFVAPFAIAKWIVAEMR